MSRLFRLAVTVEFTLVLMGLAFHPVWLPLGGSDSVQIALCLGVACVIAEVLDIFKPARKGQRRKSPSRPNSGLGPKSGG